MPPRPVLKNVPSPSRAEILPTVCRNTCNPLRDALPSTLSQPRPGGRKRDNGTSHTAVRCVPTCYLRGALGSPVFFRVCARCMPNSLASGGCQRMPNPDLEINPFGVGCFAYYFICWMLSSIFSASWTFVARTIPEQLFTVRRPDDFRFCDYLNGGMPYSCIMCGCECGRFTTGACECGGGCFTTCE